MSCWVKVKRGKIGFRVYWNGREFFQSTAWEDTSQNRKKAEGRAVEMTEEIKARTFNYLKWFPQGNLAHEFGARKTQVEPEQEALTVRRQYETWIAKKKPPFVRASLERDYKQAFNTYILPFMGKMDVNAVTVDTLENFRMYLVEEHKLAIKSARNIMDGSLRAMFRDAGRKMERNPFNDLPERWWPRRVSKLPDPYTEEERDRILDFYANHRPYWAYAFVHFRFFTGTRPSEAVALKWGTVDLRSRKAHIGLSRHLGVENATKTRGSWRTISLLSTVVSVLEKIYPLIIDPDKYMFTDGLGKPIDQSEFNRVSFQPVLRVLKIRPRPFYNTRHTYISVALTAGANIKRIAEHCGTSVTMIEEHYGRYIGDEGDAVLEAYLKAYLKAKAGPKAGPKVEDSSNYREDLASPTGFEPVLSA